MSWFYADAGRQAGPVDEAALDDLVRRGVVRDDTLVWKEGMAAWQPHASVRGPRQSAPMPSAPAAVAAGVASAPETRYCSECGRTYPASELVVIGTANVCATCKPIFMQRVREGGQALGVRRYAGFWIRFVARLIDGVLLFVVSLVVRIPLTMMGLGVTGFIPRNGGDPAAALAALPAIMGLLGITVLVNMIFAVSYEAYFVSTRGGTLGKLALGLKIIRADGSPVPVGLAVGRYFAQILSAIILYIGYIMAGFDDEKIG